MRTLTGITACGFLATLLCASCAAPHSGPAGSQPTDHDDPRAHAAHGLTDPDSAVLPNDTVREAPLADIQRWISRQWTNAARDRHTAQRNRGDVVTVTPDTGVLTNAQWRTLVRRVSHDIEDGALPAIEPACSMAYTLDRVGKLSDAIVDAAAQRLNDPDPDIVRLVTPVLIAKGAHDRSRRHLPALLNAAQTAQDPETLERLVSTISTMAVEQKGFGRDSAEVIDTMSAIISRTDPETATARMAMNAIGWMFDEPDLASGALVRVFREHPNQRAGGFALSNLRKLCARESNPSKRSRQAATRHALDTLPAAYQSHEPMVLTRALSLTSDIGTPAAHHIPRMIELLDHADPLVRAPAATALGFMREHARTALPRLRQLAASNDEATRESAQDALWLIAGEGTKPTWYDDWHNTR